MTSIYEKLRIDPPKFEITPNAREVVFTLISAMCDNKSTILIKKDQFNDYRTKLLGEAFSNIQCKFDRFDINWAADRENWDEVVSMINTGTSVISTCRSR